MDKVPRSKLIELAVSGFKEIKIFEDNTALHNPDAVAYFLHLLQDAGIVEEAGTTRVEFKDKNGKDMEGLEPILRLSKGGRKFYQSPLAIE